jgi:hypothetical protein
MQTRKSAAAKTNRLSRRLFLGKSFTGMVIAGMAVMPAWARERHSGLLQLAQGKGKISKAEAGYRDSPNNGQQCAGCTHFRGPSNCEIVEGPISPRGWCRHFKAAGGSSSSGGKTPAGGAPSSGRGY